MAYSYQAVTILQRARRRHQGAECKAREAHNDFLECLRDWQESSGTDRAICRRSVLDSLETLRTARETLLLECWSMRGVHDAVEGMRA